MSSYRQNVVHVVEHFTRIRSRHTTRVLTPTSRRRFVGNGNDDDVAPILDSCVQSSYYSSSRAHSQIHDMYTRTFLATFISSVPDKLLWEFHFSLDHVLPPIRRGRRSIRCKGTSLQVSSDLLAPYGGIGVSSLPPFQLISC